MVEELEKYPIHISSSERDILISFVRDKSGKIPDVWKQLIGKKDVIIMNAYEQGLIMGLTADQRSKIPDIWKQLTDMMNKFRENSGVVVTDLGQGFVELKDNAGIRIIREKYEWE